MTVTDQMIREAFEAVENETAKVGKDGRRYWLPENDDKANLRVAVARLGVSYERARSVLLSDWGARG